MVSVLAQVTKQWSMVHVVVLETKFSEMKNVCVLGMTKSSLQTFVSALETQPYLIMAAYVLET